MYIHIFLYLGDMSFLEKSFIASAIGWKIPK